MARSECSTWIVTFLSQKYKMAGEATDCLKQFWLLISNSQTLFKPDPNNHIV